LDKLQKQSNIYNTYRDLGEVVGLLCFVLLGRRIHGQNLLTENPPSLLWFLGWKFEQLKRKNIALADLANFPPDDVANIQTHLSNS